MIARLEQNLIRVEIDREAETDELGQAMASILQGGEVIGLVGNLGAGKTRLSRAIAEALGVDPDAIGSPTFTLIHEYPGDLPVFHFDTYRLKSADDFDDLGAADYWAAHEGVCLVEWADRVWDRLPARAWRVRITPGIDQRREVEIEIPDPATRVRLVQALNPSTQV